MKNTFMNVLKACGALFFCTLIATNYGAVSTFFNLLGNMTKGLGNITLIVLGQGDRIVTSGSFRGNIGDDGSGDGKYIGIDQLEVEEVK